MDTCRDDSPDRVLSLGSEAAIPPTHAAFKQGMRDLGWLEGRTSSIDSSTPKRRGPLGRAGHELIGQNVEVIVAGNTPATRAVQRATKTAPIVWRSARTPWRNGFIAQSGQARGQHYRHFHQTEEVLGKPIEILHEVAPGARRIAIVLNETIPRMPCSGPLPSALAPRWTSSRCALSRAPRRNSALPSRDRSTRSQAVVVIPDAMYFAERAKLQAADAGHPAAGGVWVARARGRGRVLSYAPDLAATGATRPRTWTRF